jgi:hypothetical protein
MSFHGRVLLACAVTSMTAGQCLAGSISAVAQPGMLHVIIDVCPDTVAWATTAPGQPVTTILTDELWTSAESIWLFHLNETGSFHSFDLSATLAGLSPSTEAESDGTRGYNYTYLYPTHRESEYKILPVVPMQSVVGAPEPSVATLSLLALLGFNRSLVGRRKDERVGRRAFDVIRASRCGRDCRFARNSHA